MMAPYAPKRSSSLRMRRAVASALLALVCVRCPASAPAPPAPETLEALETLARTDPMGLLERCLAHYDRTIDDYTCRFIKRERIDGRLGEAEEIDVRFMDDPFSVAMRWRKNAPVADRCLYVAGAHDGDMLLRPKGILGIIGTIRRKPDSDQVMEHTLRPITLFGFRNMLERIIAVSTRAAERGEVRWDYVGRRYVVDRLVFVLERHLPEKKGYPASRTRICIDAEHLLPICLEGWDGQGRLLYQYVFADVQLNTGLTGRDFEPGANGL